MSKEDILTYFYTNNANLDVKKILLTLLAGLCIGILISLCYYVSTRASHGVSYNQRFCFSLILTLLIASYVPLFSGKYLLVITANQALLPTDDLIAKIRPYVCSCSLTSANAAKDHSEYIFTLRAKKELSADFLRILQQEEGIATVNLVADSSEAAS